MSQNNKMNKNEKDRICEIDPIFGSNEINMLDVIMKHRLLDANLNETKNNIMLDPNLTKPYTAAIQMHLNSIGTTTETCIDIEQRKMFERISGLVKSKNFILVCTARDGIISYTDRILPSDLTVNLHTRSIDLHTTIAEHGWMEPPTNIYCMYIVYISKKGNVKIFSKLTPDAVIEYKLGTILAIHDTFKVPKLELR